MTGAGASQVYATGNLQERPMTSRWDWVKKTLGWVVVLLHGAG
jgi:hypothetical protein